MDSASQLPTLEKLREDAKLDRTVEFKGDQALAESTRLIMDLSINREMAYATADGDPGRVIVILIAYDLHLHRFEPHQVLALHA